MVRLSKVRERTKVVSLGFTLLLFISFLLMLICQNPPALENTAFGIWCAAVGGTIASIAIFTSFK